MPEKLFARLVFTITILCSFVNVFAQHVDKDIYKEKFHTLDSLLKKRQQLVDEKRENLRHFTSQYLSATHPSEQIVFARILFKEYSNFDTDSALYYANIVKNLTEQLYPEEPERKIRASLDLADTYILLGNFKDAYDVLSSLNPDEMDADNKALYFSVKEHFTNTRAVYLASESTDWQQVKDEINIYRDSIMAQKTKSSEEWLWVPLAKKLDNHEEVPLQADDKDAMALIEYMKQHPQPSNINSVNAYWLFRFYRALDMQEESLKYLLDGSIMNEKLSNRELVTLQELSKFLIEQGYYLDAYKYMQWAIVNAAELKNRSRMIDALTRGLELGSVYQKEKERSDRTIRGLIIATSIISLVLLVAIAVIIFSVSKLRKSRRKINKLNSVLFVDNDTLKRSLAENQDEKDELLIKKVALEQDLNHKNEILGAAMHAIADAFEFIQDYRSNLLKHYRKGNTKELGIMINNPDFLKEIYTEFYKKFDTTLLTVYPEFPEFFNKHVPEVYRVDPVMTRKKKALNTRMRIFALDRMGVVKNTDIAKILNIAVQTVYNTKTELGV